MSTLEWLREAVPSDDTASKVACSRLHYQGVDEMSKLNASCYGVTSVESYSSGSASKQMLHALEVANAAIGELRGRMATLEAENDGANRRCEKAEARACLVREEVEARARSEQAALMQRIIVAETRAAAAERSAAEALAAARSASGQENEGLSRRLALAEARLDMVVQERPPLPAYTNEDARVERTMARAEREAAAVRAACDELRSRLQRAEARADEESARTDSMRERISRAEEQVLSQRSVFDATLQETKLRQDELASTVGDERERGARTDQRLTSHQLTADEHAANLTSKVEALNVDHNFLREHLARVEEKLRNLPVYDDVDLVLSPDEPSPAAFKPARRAPDSKSP